MKLSQIYICTVAQFRSAIHAQKECEIVPHTCLTNTASCIKESIRVRNGYSTYTNETNPKQPTNQSDKHDIITAAKYESGYHHWSHKGQEYFFNG
jgi:hypothetical protein